ncbi:SDR family NAD(P)-dependent oxidoreductase [Novosphingobium sp. SG720]|uniref:SDR family NAD(P)-dependent oxidoreductase n=1 Tax=Novosphingobium sp. SG720 TaxID=2586998 RepID=UPI001B2FE993|nr:SDR family NAD(P)-dependent oxidoreductase [Novosphingobium sp. SG720]
MSRCGRIDVLINNAGVSLAGPVEATSDAEALALFDTNLFGALRMTRAVLPTMRQQSSGMIINISSVLGFLPGPFMGLYASSKHALEGLSESLDHEVRGFGIRVVLVQPGFTNTSLDANATLTQEPLPAYESALQSSLTAVQRQIAEGAAPSSVAAEILAAIAGNHRLRRPVGSGARMLSVLRRFAPSPLLDRGIRKTFALRA